MPFRKRRTSGAAWVAAILVAAARPLAAQVQQPRFDWSAAFGGARVGSQGERSYGGLFARAGVDDWLNGDWAIDGQASSFLNPSSAGCVDVTPGCRSSLAVSGIGSIAVGAARRLPVAGSRSRPIKVSGDIGYAALSMAIGGPHVSASTGQI